MSSYYVGMSLWRPAVVNPGPAELAATLSCHPIFRLGPKVQVHHLDPTRCIQHPSNRRPHRPKPTMCPSKPRNESACVNHHHPSSMGGCKEDASRQLTEATYLFPL